MHDALRQRLLRRIESLPDAQVYQVLDFIEFLESKYAGTEPVEASGLQKFAESLEDKLRKKAVSPNTIREAFQLISAADRVLHGVSSAGKQILSELNTALEVPEGQGGEGAGGDGAGARTGEAARPGAGSAAERGAKGPPRGPGPSRGGARSRPAGTPDRPASGDRPAGPDGAREGEGGGSDRGDGGGA